LFSDPVISEVITPPMEFLHVTFGVGTPTAVHVREIACPLLKFIASFGGLVVKDGGTRKKYKKQV
jgi:hypothetical protein